MKIRGVDLNVEDIDPHKAAEMLKRNRVNRKLDEALVEKYAHDMRSGNWTDCLMPIAFYEGTNDVAEGQHRLHAIIKSGTTQRFTIRRHFPREAGLNIDTGKPRSLVDNARISGVDDELSNAMVAAARAIEEGQPATKSYSNAQRLEMVDKHRQAAEWAVRHMPRTKFIANAAVIGAVARAWYHERDKERLDHFCKVLGNGFAEGEVDSAAVAMRNYLLANGGQAASYLLWRDTFMKVQNAISYFMRKRRLTVIKSIKDEPYPLPRHMTKEKTQ